MEPIRIAFLWHQHQPYYKDPTSRRYILPWVRLHGLKDYYDLPAVLENYPTIHQNINLVPSLLLQLEDYLENDAKDEILLKTEIPAEALTTDDKFYLLKYFFMVNAEHLIRPYPGYWRLFQKRGADLSEKALRKNISLFSAQDFLDLQVWYNLAWTGETHKNRSPFAELVAKDHDFSEADKMLLLQEQRKILAKIIPEHKKLVQKGQVELSTTPFFHPIIPLLCDTQVAQVALPQAPLPEPPFRFPEDAHEHLQRAREFFKNRFGFYPRGMWPSEGSVSDEAALLFARNGLQWIATDEEILFQSLRLNRRNYSNRALQLYRAYSLETAAGSLYVFFRDHTLSDLIGFVYQKWDADEAARDFVERIRKIRLEILQAGGEKALKNAIVPVILDGENCWEFYPQNGRPFLKALYNRLSESGEIRSVTFSEFLQSQPEAIPLEKIYPGSWINHNFAIWVGNPEDNRAWDILRDARQDFEEKKASGLDKTRGEKAFREIMAAEGSDWFWWFGDDHFTENAAEFDLLFRRYLLQVYEWLQLEAPAALYEPIHREKLKTLHIEEPQGFIHPEIDGAYSNYFEWLGAGVFTAVPLGSSMQMVATHVARILFGFDLEHLFIRIEPKKKMDWQSVADMKIVVDFLKPAYFRFTFSAADLRKGRFSVPLFKKTNSKWEKTHHVVIGAFKDFIEAKVLFEAFGVKPGDELGFRVRVLQKGQILETWPEGGLIPVKVPDADWEQEDWMV